MKDMNNSKNNNEKEKINVKQEIAEWAIVFVLAIVFSVIINTFVLINARVPSASMENNVMTGDRLFGNRLSYIKEDPKRGDIVIFRYPDDETQLFIKRVIGLPGETVMIIDGKVYIDDKTEPLNEPYLAQEMLGTFGPYEVPENAYFVMGDNRNYSLDARFWNNTYVYKDKILGKALIRYYPSIGKIENSAPVY
ncbi:MAG: signal peptidase I [Lachnospiraceae bacterium]|nr:signal peptidase I [Lachnospiraceae bacterium]